MITDFHAKYFAYEITKRCSSGSVEKLTAVLADAGAILADEVGPGKTTPFPGETINPGPYRMAKGVEDANTYRVGHPLAQRVLARARELEPEPADVVLDYAASGKNIASLEPLRGGSGWLACAHVSMSALESEDQLVFAGSVTTVKPWTRRSAAVCSTCRPRRERRAASPTPWRRSWSTL